MPPDQANLMKLFGYVMTPLTLWFTINFSAGLQLFLLTTGFFQALQSWLFLQPAFRSMVGLPPMNKITAIAAKPFSASGTTWQAPRTMSTTATAVEDGKLGLVDDAKDSAKKAKASLTQKLRDYNAKGDVKERARKAAKYEEKRALEERERYYARMEEMRLKALEQKQKGQ